MIRNYISRLITLDPDFLNKLIVTAVVIAFLLLIKVIANRLVYLRTVDVRVRYNWRRGISHTLVIIAFLIVGRIWFAGFQSLATYLGLLSAGIAIALKDPLANLAAWVFIIWRRPFSVGDRIEIGAYRGDVIDLRIFQFTLMEVGNWVAADQSTGRIIRIPNGKVFTEMLANYSKGFKLIWNEIPVLITFESNWKQAKKILSRIGMQHAEHLTKEAEKEIREASARMMIFYRNLAPIVYTSVKECGVLLTIRYLCEPRGRRDSEHAIWENILEEFSNHNNIDFAYPTQRFFDNSVEGKTCAKADPSET